MRNALRIGGIERPRRVFAMVTFIACVAVGVLPGGARSAFPGTNGKIAFIADETGAFDNFDVYVMNADGTGRTRLTTAAGDDEDPVWSADGSKIAFTSRREGNSKIFRMDADGNNQTRMTDAGPNPPPPFIPVDRFPAWSPDGTKLAFARNQELWRVDADGTGLVQLTALPADGIEPVWSPDGTKIAFTSGRDGNFEIYAMNADGTSQTKLTTDGAWDVGAAWSPDGSKIAFQSNRDGDHEVFVMNADGTGQTQLTFNPALDSAPAWSPDGTMIAFQSNRDGDFEIFVMNADGTSQMQLTFNTLQDRLADWQPQPSAPSDTTPPVLTVPADVTVDATSNTGAVVSYVASATDAVDPSPTVSCSPPSGATFPIGTTTVTCTALDVSGNTSSGSFAITVLGAGDQLIDLVEELAAASALPPGLTNVLRSFDPANPAELRALCGTLNAVARSLERSTDPQAAGWLADVERLQGLLGC